MVIKWHHLDQEEASVSGNSWLAIVNHSGEVLKGVDALTELCRLSFFPLCWLFSGVVSIFPDVVDDLGGWLGSGVDSDSALAYKRVPKAPGKLPLHQGDGASDGKRKKSKGSALGSSLYVLGTTWLVLCMMFVLSQNLYAAQVSSGPPGFILQSVGSTSALQQQWDTFSNVSKAFDYIKVHGTTWGGHEFSVFDGGFFGYWSGLPWTGFVEPRSMFDHIGSLQVKRYMETALFPDAYETA